jgi:glycosyltransferase involved in cell wall biosynthesis
MKLPLAAVIITMNEEKNIERCLRSLDFVQEIVVLDSGSSDGTRKICESFGVQFYTQVPFLGFGAQKAKASQLASQDWILSVDADEEVSPGLRAELIQAFSNLNPQTAYRLPRLSYHLGRWIRHGGWYPDFQTRLFHRKFSSWDQAEIHEKVQAPRYEKLKNNLNHYAFKDLSHQVHTNDKYSTLQSIADRKAGKHFSLFKLLTKPLVKFFECYFFKQGFRDGLPGFIIAVGAAYSVFLRWSKTWEDKEKLQ